MADEKDPKKKLKQWAEDFDEHRYVQGEAYRNQRKWPGLCGRCRSFVYVEGETEILLAGCSHHNIRHDWGCMPLNRNKPVRSCTEFWPLGQPDLKELVEQAKIIQVFRDQGGHYL